MPQIPDADYSPGTSVVEGLPAHIADTTDVHGIENTAFLVTLAEMVAQILAHNDDTTDVHGIPDTSLLGTGDAAAEVAAHNADTTSVHGIADSTVLATDAEVASAVSTHEADTTSVHGISNTANLETVSGAASQIATHSADSTAVHGITDTAALETISGAAAQISTHNADSTAVHGITDTAALETTTGAATQISTHNSDTTAVHGITDTAALETTTGAQSKADAAAAASVAKTVADAKGDLIVATAADTFAKLTAGADATELVADSATASGLRWITPRTIDPKSPAYDAVGDGSTDDSAALNTALAAAYIAGSDVFLPAGVFVCEGVDILGDVTLRGGGRRSILKHKGSSATYCISFPDTTNNAAMVAVTVNGNNPNQTGDEVTVQMKGTRNRITGCHIYDAGLYSIHVFDATDPIIDHNWLYKVNGTFSTKTALSAGIWLGGPSTTGGIVDANNITDTEHSCISGGHWIDGAITNNVARACGSGIDPHGEGNLRLVVSNNIVTNSDLNGIHLAGEEVTVTGNIIETPANEGISIVDSAGLTPFENVTISGNTVANAGDEGINCNTGVRLSITGNRVRGCGSHGIQVSNTQGVTITGNGSFGNTADGIVVNNVTGTAITGNSTLSNTSEGVVVTHDDTDGVNISGNFIRGSTTGQIRVADAGDNITIADNIVLGTAPFTIATASAVRLHHTGAGTPEAAVVARIGSTWRRTDGGVGTTLYTKESGTGNTGWSAGSTPTYRTIESTSIGGITDANTAALYVSAPGGGPTTGAGAAAGIRMFHFDPADYAIAGRTTKLDIKATLGGNATSPGTWTLTCGLHAVTAVAGTADTMTYTITATAVTGSTGASFVNPGANAQATDTSTDFDVPTAGYYALGYTTTATPTADFRGSVKIDLRVHHV